MKPKLWASIAFIGLMKLAAADCLTMSHGLEFAGRTPRDAVVNRDDVARADAELDGGP